MATNEMVKDTTPRNAGFIDRGSNHAVKQARLAKDESELEELMAKQKGGSNEDEESKEPDSESSEDSEVQVESNTKQEEAEESAEAQEETSDLSREEKSFKKRYGDLRRHSAKKEKELKDRIEALENNSTTAPIAEDDIEEWSKANPEIAKLFEAIAYKKASERVAGAEERLRAIDEAQYELTRSKAEDVIRQTHSDFDTLRNADEFHDWVEAQPKVVRDALYENSDDPASVIRVIDLYKVDNGLTPAAKKKKTKDAAKTVTRKSTPNVSEEGAGSALRESQVQKMSDAEFESKYDAIQEAMASGKFIYDITGKAR